MRSRLSSFCILAAAGMFTAALAATNAQANDQNRGQQNESQHEQANSANAKQAPEGFVMVDERLVMLTANEPQNHFLKAKEYLSSNDPRAAAAEIRIGASYLDMQASRKGPADQQGLKSMANHLRKVADELGSAEKSGEQNNKETSAQRPDQKKLDHAFAAADRVLAEHFQQEAKNDLDRNHATMAGEDLDAAVASLTASCTWSNKQISQECTKTVADARKLSDQLLAPPSQTETANNQSQAEEQNSEAQPAGARISGNEEQANQSNAQIPNNAKQVVDDLGKAIAEISPQHHAGQAKGQSAEQSGQQSNKEISGNK